VSINRPATDFDGPSHTYKVEGQDVLGISTVAKVGGVEDAWGTASAWGFKIGWQGALAVLSGQEGDALVEGDEYPIAWPEQERLYGTLKARGLTPWSTRDRAADRGNYVHDLLEGLGNDGTVPEGFWNRENQEEVGHARGVLQWFLDYRPSFVALEVQVASRKHGFAGRYDVRCEIPYATLPLVHGRRSLCLVDLKTSKRTYPLTHYPQLAGYELASVEMGFPATDAQFVLNTHSDGSYDFKQSYATGADFLAYLGAMRAIRRLQAEDPEAKIQRAREEEVLRVLGEGPRLSRDLKAPAGPLAGLDGRAIGLLCGSLRKRGLVEQDERKVWHLVAAPG
jgi:hypothetical protein